MSAHPLSCRNEWGVGWIEHKRNLSTAAPRGEAHDGFRFAQPILQVTPKAPPCTPSKFPITS
jgi:hypothetical protein